MYLERRGRGGGEGKRVYENLPLRSCFWLCRNSRAERCTEYGFTRLKDTYLPILSMRTHVIVGR